MQGWTQRMAPDAEMMDRYIQGAIEEEFARYSPPPGTGKWSNQREVEEARAVEGPCQTFDARAVNAALDYLERYFADPVYVFVDTEYEQYELAADDLGDLVNYIEDGMEDI